MRTALVVNCSAKHYNLGAAKLAGWLRAEGWAVTEHAGDPGWRYYPLWEYSNRKGQAPVFTREMLSV